MRCADVRVARAIDLMRGAGYEIPVVRVKTGDEVKLAPNVPELLRIEGRLRRARMSGMGVDESMQGPPRLRQRARSDYSHATGSQPNGIQRLGEDAARRRRARQTHPGKRLG